LKNSKKIYLHLAIAKSGLASRRKAEKLVRAGSVKVGGKVILRPEYPVNTEEDIIEVDGRKIELEEEKIYFLLNKPKGVLSAAKDSRGQETVIDLLPVKLKKRLYPVGRLDKDTTGILILTNDGELTFRLTHPKFKILKTYSVVCFGKVDRIEVKKLEKGVEIDGKKTLPAKIENVKFDKQASATSLLIKIYEGRKRQVKKMFLKIGHPVISLKRTEYAELGIGGLKEGKMRCLNAREIAALNKKTGICK